MRGIQGVGQAVWAECSTSSRCGLMLTLATNLLLWLLAVSNDSMHHEIEAELSALMKKISGKRRPWEKAMAPHSSTLAWKIPWTEEPGRLQSMGSQRVSYD